MEYLIAALYKAKTKGLDLTWDNLITVIREAKHKEYLTEKRRSKEIEDIGDCLFGDLD